MSTGVRSGLLLAVLGVWLIMRATHQDAGGKTLINHIIDGGGASTAAAQAASNAALAAQVPAAGGVNLASPSAEFSAATQAAILPSLRGYATTTSAVTAAASAPNPRLAAAQGQIQHALQGLTVR